MLKNRHKKNSLAKIFLTACGIGLALTTGSANATEKLEVIPLTCPTPKNLEFDKNNKAWIKVKALTNDLLPINFDLSIDYELSRNAEEMNRLTCLNMIQHIHNLGAYRYKTHIFSHSYIDMPKQAPLIQSHVKKELDQFIQSIMDKPGFSIEIKDISTRNVTAPGLASNHAQGMMTKGIQYNYDKTDNPNRMIVQNWDGRKVAYTLNITYQPKKDVYYAIGPNREGIKRNILNAAREMLQEQALKRGTLCAEKDLKYFESAIHSAMLKNTTLNSFIYLLDFKITNVETLEKTEKISPTLLKKRPRYPVCFSLMEEKKKTVEKQPSP